MQCYTELLPPSGVTHAISTNFLSATSNNLIVAKTSLLQVFSLLDTTYDGPQTNGHGKPSQDPQHTTKLVLTAEYEVPGTITGLGRAAALPGSKSKGDIVLVATRSAKLSLIEWDPALHKISTVSIHYYESDTISTNPWVPDFKNSPSSLSVDPNNRCAVLHFGLHNIAILPFHQSGDELIMDDLDSDVAMEGGSENQGTNGSSSISNTPYTSSFVLPLTALDPSLIHPAQLAFLHEYREPTFGILYSSMAVSSSLALERKDALLYSVFTLDLQQRASTILLTVSKLPSDLFQIMPLSAPVGGALLIGSNEIIHVDQAGKTNAVGVNEFAKHASSYSMVDQSSLGMQLEGCIIEQLGVETGDVLLVLADGRMFVLGIKLDGRSVSGLTIRPITDQVSGASIKSQPSCSTALGGRKLFVGSETDDSVLLAWSKPSLNAEKSGHRVPNETMHEQDTAETDGIDVVDTYEDDLYSAAPLSSVGSPAAPQAENSGSDDPLVIRIHDRLWNLGPIRDIAIGRSSAPSDKHDSYSFPQLEMVATRGSGNAGGLAILQQQIDAITTHSFQVDDVHGVWAIQANNSKAKEAEASVQRQEHDRYLLLTKSKSHDKEESVVYSIGDDGLEEAKASEFNPNEDVTVEIGTLAGGTRVVQVLKTEIRGYDSDLALAQIYPISDEDSDEDMNEEERTVQSASFSEPYLLISLDNQSIEVLQADEHGDLDKMPIEGMIKSTKWLTGCLYKDEGRNFNFGIKSNAATCDNILLFLLNHDSELFIFSVSDMSEPLFSVDGVNTLPSHLPLDPPPKRSTAREEVYELLVSDLGDSVSQRPYMILRTVKDDIILYEPYQAGEERELRFIKVLSHFPAALPAPASDDRIQKPHASRRALQPLPDVSGYRTVFMPGSNPSFIIMSSISSPHVISLRGRAVQSLSSAHIPGCERGFAFVDSDSVVRISALPQNSRLDFSWVTRKINIGQEVGYVSYIEPPDLYVVGTSSKIPFKLPEEESQAESGEAVSLTPHLERGAIKVLEPRSWNVIDSYQFEVAERITCIESINMEVSETSSERKNVLVVGTSIVRGEDVVPRGRIYIFTFIDVVPEPGSKSPDKRLKNISKEEIKGAVTAISGIGGQGFLIVAQGQKCYVRGLKEDGSLLPVAFMDVQCYVTVLRELKGTGICIMGDALKGLWLTGYSEEPYKLTLFGKSNARLPVVAAEFLPYRERLYILVADDDSNINVLQYDPEDPSSSKGDRLLHRSVFQTGNYISSMTLLPRVSSQSASRDSKFDTATSTDTVTDYQVLITSHTGSIAVVTPIPEESYRRLLALQLQLVNSLEHPCGANPRAYRAVESDGIGGQRGMIDGSLLSRWCDLATQRKVDMAARVGTDVESIRADLEALDGGLLYL